MCGYKNRSFLHSNKSRDSYRGNLGPPNQSFPPQNLTCCHDLVKYIIFSELNNFVFSLIYSDEKQMHLTTIG